MSFYVGLVLWMGVGIVLMLWASGAERKWQQLLTSRGLMPEGPDNPASAVVHPVLFFRRRWKYLTVAYPRALHTTDSEVETWCLRRSRRRRLFVAWMFGGLIMAILTIAAIDAGRDNSWWFAALIPIAALLGYLAKVGYAYGSGTIDEVGAAQHS